MNKVHRVCWPNEQARREDGALETVTILLWDYDLRTGRAVTADGRHVDVYMTSYCEADLTIGVLPCQAADAAS